MSASYLLRTKPMGEAKAIAGLTRHHHTAFTPVEQRVMRASGRTKRKRVVLYPLAPRYVVAEMADPFAAVHQVDEVTGVVSTAGQTALRAADVARLRAMDGSKAETVLHKALAVGQQIRVRSGPFIDHPGVIDLIDGDTATINVQLFGRPTPATMPLEWLDPL